MKISQKTYYAALLMVIAMMASCKGGFSVNISPDSIILVQGQTTSVMVNIEPSGGFKGQVEVTVSGLPQGVTAGLLTITPGNVTGTLTLSAESSAATGMFGLTVQAAGSGTAATASLALSVVTEESRLAAFPGAEGFGAYATGGRGGRVIYVTTLNA
ncbi:MAG: hypothetical protein NTZ51_01850, partial [Proteobacteria bacterium]|nr:hypothetical protein [Pseudomonadota bacterium]